MQFFIDRDTLLKPLQMVSGAIERRHTLPILSNVLLDVTRRLVVNRYRFRNRTGGNSAVKSGTGAWPGDYTRQKVARYLPFFT